MNRRLATALAFGPSLLAGALAAVWWALDPPARTPAWPLLPALAAGLATGGALLAAAAWLERALPSFAWVSRQTERALARLAPSPGLAAVLALATSLGEEALFRGLLLERLGLIGQALAFGALHPAGRRGWSYPLFAALAGLALGALVQASGRVSAAVVAHLLVNAVGLLARGRGRRGRATALRARTRRSGPPPP